MDLEKIILQVKNGNQAAFRTLVESYQSYAFTLAFRIVCNEEDARDVVQESFLNIWRNIKKYKPSVKFTTWMYKIVTHAAIDQYRKNKRKITTTLNDSAIQPLNPNKNQDNKELAELIEQMAKGLPEKQRLVFVLRDLQGFKSEEVQEMLELSETVVKSNLYHARKSVRDKMEKLLVYERRTT